MKKRLLEENLLKRDYAVKDFYQYYKKHNPKTKIKKWDKFSAIMNDYHRLCIDALLEGKKVYLEGLNYIHIVRVERNFNNPESSLSLSKLVRTGKKEYFESPFIATVKWFKKPVQLRHKILYTFNLGRRQKIRLADRINKDELNIYDYPLLSKLKEEYKESFNKK